MNTSLTSIAPTVSEIMRSLTMPNVGVLRLCLVVLELVAFVLSLPICKIQQDYPNSLLYLPLLYIGLFPLDFGFFMKTLDMF